MAAPRFMQEELALEEISRQAEDLERKHKELSELPKKVARERKERDNTLPPMNDIQELERQKRMEDEFASRGEWRNLRKAHNGSLALLFLLCASTCALIAWGLTLMKG